MPLYTFHDPLPELHDPVLVVHLEGWIDAGSGGSGAMNVLRNTLESTAVAAFDSDLLLDHRARRPVVRLVDGVSAGLSWPRIQVLAAKDRGGRDVLLLTGAEPDYHWRAFARDVRALGAELGVRLMVGLGAFASPVPHTRPCPVVATATSAGTELARSVGVQQGTFEVPAGIEAALEQGFGGAGVPALGLWAKVPHYVAGRAYPGASLGLLQTLSSVAGLELDLTALEAAAAEARAPIDVLVAANPQFSELVARLESQADAEEEFWGFSGLPTGDEMAAELERFLREQEEG